jgi:two-component system, response regulator YesN
MPSIPTLVVVDSDPDSVALPLQNVAMVVTGRTFAAGLAAVRQHRPAITVVEYWLPDGSGLSLVALLRANHPDMPVVMATGHGSERVCAAAFRLGIAEYFIKPVQRRELVARVSSLLVSVAAMPNESSRGASAAPRLDELGPVGRIAQVAQVLEAKYDERIALRDLATIAAMSRYELSRRFTRVMGRSIRQFVSERRICRAEELLMSGSSVTDVALAVGYSDLPRFDKAFRRVVGCSPSEFRRRATTDKRTATSY